MSALDELHYQCARRGWRLSLDGSYPNGKREAGLVVDVLEVRSRPDAGRELLADSPTDPDLDRAAVACAVVLDQRGLIR